ncbi:MAG TPA: prolyl aminopeptidase [Pseudomonadota bacterium]|nr:prolyl aminopeptidase [Pseudomonadota bacterium]
MPHAPPVYRDAGRDAGPSARRTLYPPCEPYTSGHLRVSPVHEIYYEVSGNPQGQPVVFVHGGPGSGTEPNQRRFFDPSAYRIVLFDQRGAGRSRPHASLEDNTTWHLVADMEQLRQHLGIDKWLVFGGSWGSTLCLAYAETHPEHCLGLILRGIFLLSRRETQWFYQDGACQIFPDAWDDFVSIIPEAERGDLVSAYYRRLTCGDPAVEQGAARAWSLWEARTSKLFEDPQIIARFTVDRFALSIARIEAHYFMNDGFLRTPDQLLTDVGRIRHLPAVIVQGRYDVVCPIEAAWKLHRAWPEAELRIVPDAGHAATEPGTLHELILATDRFRSLSSHTAR